MMSWPGDVIPTLDATLAALTYVIATEKSLLSG